MESLNKSCIMCGSNVYDGIILNGEKICKACEEKIINADVIDHNYDTYKDKIKVVLFNQHAMK